MSNPNVNISEINRSYRPFQQNNDIAAFVGFFEKGPVNKPIFITSVYEFKMIFGRATAINQNDWYQVYNYLQYASGIYVIRSLGIGSSNANSSGSADIYFQTREEFEEIKESLEFPINKFLSFVAQSPGEWGNLLKVAVFTKAEYDQNVEVYDGVYAQDIFTFMENDYYGIVVFRNNKVVEKYYKYLEDIKDINDESYYVYTTFKGNKNIDILPSYGDNIYILDGGLSVLPSSIDLMESYEILENTDRYDIDIIIGNDRDNNLAINSAERRKDCIAFIGIPVSIFIVLAVTMNGSEFILHTEKGDVIVLNSTKTFESYRLSSKDISKVDSYINIIANSEYCHFTLNIKRIYDKFSGDYILVNIAGDTAGLKAQASVKSPWNPSAGLEKGQIKNYDKIYLDVNKNQIYKYLKMGVNCISTNGGYVISQKTYTTKPTSFDRVNTRALFNYLERNTKKLLRNFVFEENTYQLRGLIATEIKRFLVSVKANDGIESGKVHVKEGSSNEIIIDIYVKPKYVAEFIQLRMINVGTDEITTAVKSSGI